VAWFHYRLAELELRAGHLDAADSSFLRGLTVHPDDYRILGGLSRSAAARSQWQRSIEYGERAIAIQLDPATLGTLSTSYRELDDTAQARSYAKAMSANALEQPGPIHRAWGLFLLDHGTPADVRRVVAKTRLEMRERRDVYAHDLLAWGLYRQRDFRGARSAIALALAQGTEDAQLHHHAGMIADALGDTTEARVRFERMRELNPIYAKGR
jgi:tetratricopeptide (TPR) repeat protein